MVGGLVQQQGVGVGEQDAGEFDATALTTGEGTQGLAEDLVGQSQAGSDRGGLGLGGVPAQHMEALVPAGVLAHTLVTGLLVVAGHLLLGLAQTAERLVDTAGGEDAVAGEHVEVTGTRVLGQIADTAGRSDGAVGGLSFPRQDAGHGGLARAVAPHQPDLVPGSDPERGRLQEEAGSDAQFEVGGDQHGWSFLGGGVTDTCAVARARSRGGRDLGNPPSLTADG